MNRRLFFRKLLNMVAVVPVALEARDGLMHADKMDGVHLQPFQLVNSPTTVDGIEFVLCDEIVFKHCKCDPVGPEPGAMYLSRNNGGVFLYSGEHWVCVGHYSAERPLRDEWDVSVVG